MNNIGENVYEKFRKIIADQEKKIRQQEGKIQRLKQQEEEKVRLLKRTRKN